MKFGQVIEYNEEYFFKNYGENEAGRLVPNLFVFQESFLWVKASDLQLIFNVSIVLYKTWDYWSRDMVNFEFLEKGVGLALHHILCMIFQEK